MYYDHTGLVIVAVFRVVFLLTVTLQRCSPHYRRVKTKVHAFLNSALDRSEWSVYGCHQFISVHF